MAEVVLSREQLVKNYFAREDTIQAYSTIDLYPAEKKVLLKYFTPGSTILDLGCGAGRTSIDLAKKGYKVVGIDFASTMIEAAKRQAKTLHLDIPFYVQDATKMDFPAASFDHALFSYNGLEQIPGKKNREKVLIDVYKILKHGGYFIFTTRSGLAFGSRRSLVWIPILLHYFYKRYLKGQKNWELGDKAWGGNYISYSNPFKIKAAAKRAGFELLDFNSEKNIEQNKNGTWLTSFSSDRMLFYVFKKPVS